MRDWSPKTRPPPLATTHTRTFARTCTHTHAHVCSHTRIHTHTPQLREKRYGDFPRVRVLLDPQHYSFPSRRTTSSTDRHTPSQTETAQNRKRKALSVARTVQKIFLISPLAVLLSLSLLLLMSGLLNDGARVTSGGEGGRGGLLMDEVVRTSFFLCVAGFFSPPVYLRIELCWNLEDH